MGLCKCPKRKVTTLFCFEHAVNVCEHCIVVNHPKCIIQSYIRWLHDSEYKPNCGLCNGPLESEECVRLICYHVYHWRCLNNSVYEQIGKRTTDDLPDFKCPDCNKLILPQDKVVSPVAAALREKLLTVNWARSGLGLPEIMNEEEFKPNSELPLQHLKKNSPPMQASKLRDDVVLHVDENMFPTSRPEETAQFPRRVGHGSSNSKLLLVEEDESKYRRRYSIFAIPRWLKSIGSKVCSLKRNPWKIITVLIALFVLWLLFSLTGSSSHELNETNLT
ncbi:zinc finger protein-like 1 [Cimex lectularius]|uniref:Zinc finger protein-like 1 homolog n=1 Tax=Cimex lectularius TaxID=79782 RepID=A0A8I6RSS9_CIMLE|nr:zinc finger protein-like 1 [Cimex lectularius]